MRPNNLHFEIVRPNLALLTAHCLLKLSSALPEFLFFLKFFDEHFAPQFRQMINKKFAVAVIGFVQKTPRS